MLDIRLIEDHEEDIRRALGRRGVSSCVDALIKANRERRSLITEVESLKHRRNADSKEIGQLRKQGLDTAEKQKAVRAIGEKIAALEDRLRFLEKELEALALAVPNMPHSSVPDGVGAQDNVVVRTHGEKPSFPFQPKTHVEIGERLGIFDFSRAAKMTGAGFILHVGVGALLERALIRFMIEMHVREHGYTEVSPPFLCNSAAMTGTGQLPKMAEDMYSVSGEDLYLVPTAEVPVTNIFRDEIIERPLPIKLVAYSPCFRREAGAAGRQTRGLIRVHQFDKVEMVKFVEPPSSYDELELLVDNAEDVLKRLELPYRVVTLCAGDLSFAAAKCYDIELWAPGQNAWLEVSSCSNFEAFQALRAGIRYRNAKGRPEFVHTLNGSGVALARLVVALLENGQQADGSVAIPEALVPYMDGLRAIAPGKNAWKA